MMDSNSELMNIAHGYLVAGAVVCKALHYFKENLAQSDSAEIMIKNKVHQRVIVMPLKTLSDDSRIRTTLVGGEMMFNGITTEINIGLLFMYRILKSRPLLSDPITKVPESGDAGVAGTMRRNYV